MFIHEKNDNMGAKTVPRGAKSHCHFSMDEPIGSFSPVHGGFEFDLNFRICVHLCLQIIHF